MSHSVFLKIFIRIIEGEKKTVMGIMLVNNVGKFIDLRYNMHD